MYLVGFVEYKKTVFLLVLVLFSSLILFTYSSAYNYDYVNVSTRVNVTNAYPSIDIIRIDQNILLTAGATQIVRCNVSLHDWNGYSDIVSVNATLWDNNTVNFSSPDNNNTHYTNNSCLNLSQSGYYANYTCAFNVWYYANNGSNWLCNATVRDNYNFTSSGQNSTSIQGFYALNVTSLIDYGNMVLADFSPNVSVNISNIGNLRINVSVLGYGGSNKAAGTNYSMFCQFGNITIDNERFSVNSSADFNAKTNLSSYSQNVSGVSIPKTVNGVALVNTTYWQLYTSPVNNPFGLCNGTVEFTASAG